MDEHDMSRLRKFVKQSKEGLPYSELVDITDIVVRHSKTLPMYMKILVREYEQTNKVYTYMLTFTIDPSKYDVENKELHDIIEAYVIDFGERRNPLKCDVVKEKSDKHHKHTHWHLGLETKKYIDFSNFLKFYRKTYGIVDITKSWSNDYKNVLIYINKSTPSQQIV